MRELRILFLAPQLPWPLDTGAKIRTYHLLQALARDHDLQLLCFGAPDPAGAAAVEAVQRTGARCRVIPPPRLLGRAVQLASGLLGPLPFNVRKYQHHRFSQAIAEQLQTTHADVVHCDHLHLAPHGRESGRPFVIDEHNIETMIWQRFAKDANEPLYKRALFLQQAMLLRRAEARLCQRASLVLVCSRQDQIALETLVAPAQVATELVPNGVDVAFFTAPGPSRAFGHVVFTGSMDWAPNENAARTFVREIWPVAKQALAQPSFYIVGRNPSERLLSLHGQGGVIVTGTVDDIRPYLRQALALAVPMRVGGGTRLKILEAFAARVPVVSTALGIEGIEAHADTHYLRAESAEEFAGAFARLRGEPELRDRLTRTAFALASTRYSWDAVGRRLAQHYSDRFFTQGA